MAYSRFRYLEVETYKDFFYYGDLSDEEIANYISRAEELIDIYIGWQNKFFPLRITSKAEGGTKTTLVDSKIGSYQNGYFKNCYLKILSGTNAGEERFITNWYSTTFTIEVDIEFSNPIDETCVYAIEQYSKFPRVNDIFIYEDVIYKTIPTDLSLATAIQTEWIIKKGKNFLLEGGDKFNSESLGGYSYSKNVYSEIDALISPLAKTYLYKYRNRAGRFLI